MVTLVTILPLISSSFSLFSKFLTTAPSTPNGISISITSPNFFCSLARSRYSIRFWLLCGLLEWPNLLDDKFFPSSQLKTRSGLQTRIKWFIYMLKSLNIFNILFFINHVSHPVLLTSWFILCQLLIWLTHHITYTWYLKKNSKTINLNGLLQYHWKAEKLISCQECWDIYIIKGIMV